MNNSDMSSPLNREEALFQAAVALTGAERGAFLKGACLGDDPAKPRMTPWNGSPNPRQTPPVDPQLRILGSMAARLF